MQIAGRGRIVVWEGVSLWVLASPGEESGTDFHAHHAIQITISLAGGFLVRTLHQQSSGPITLVAADAQHIFEASGVAAFLFVEPESNAGRALAARWLTDRILAEIEASSVGPIVATLYERFAAACPDADLVEAGSAFLAAVAAQAPSPPTDARVQAMIDFVRSNLDGRLTLTEAAACAHLSPSRARHRFAADTGLPFKTFVLWQRLERAVELYAKGHSLTVAAHEAGFADSAHLSRTFRKTFGIPASMLELT
jgi:AraC family transcriptional regulator